MNRNRFAIAVLSSVLAFGFAAPAFADDDRDRRGHDRDHGGRGERHDDRRNWQADRRGDQRHWQADRRDDRRDYRRDDRREDHRAYRGGYPQGYRDARVRDRDYGYRAPPRHSWARGQRYHDYYQGPVYVVNDYPRYHVRRPPRGHHWVRDDRGNLLMVAIATGIIADLVLNR